MKTYSQNPQVQQWMESLYRTLQAECGDIPDGWGVQLHMLAYQLELYLAARKEIEENGLIVVTERGRVKSPAISVVNSTSLTICKLINSFGLSRASRAKIKEEKDALTAEQLIQNLLD